MNATCRRHRRRPLDAWLLDRSASKLTWLLAFTPANARGSNTCGVSVHPEKDGWREVTKCSFCYCNFLGTDHLTSVVTWKETTVQYKNVPANEITHFFCLLELTTGTTISCSHTEGRRTLLSGKKGYSSLIIGGQSSWLQLLYSSRHRAQTLQGHSRAPVGKCSHGYSATW